MTTAPVRPVPVTSRLTVPTVPSRRWVAAAEFDPTIFPHDEDDKPGMVRHFPVQFQRPMGRNSLSRLPAVLGRPAAAVVHTTAILVTLPGRVVQLVTLAEQTLTAMHAAVTRTDALIDRVEAVTRTVKGVVQAASRTVTTAAGTVEQARTLTARVAPLLEGYSEPLRHLEPMVRRLAETTKPSEVDALVTLLDRLPQLADAMEHEVIPLLRHLDQVGPDVNQLLDSVSQLNHMASRLAKVFRRRNHPDP